MGSNARETTTLLGVPQNGREYGQGRGHINRSDSTLTSSSTSSATVTATTYGATNEHSRQVSEDELVRDQAGTDIEGQRDPQKSHLSIVIPMSLGIFLAAIDGTIVVSSYAAIGSELKQLQSTSWIATAYLLTLTSFQPLYGKLSDIFGRKPCLLFAYSVFAIGSFLCGIAPTMNTLIVARALAGVGGGGMTTVVTIIVSDVVPLRQRGMWQGVLNIIFALGAASGAPLGGFLADNIGWRWAFLIQVPIAILAFLSVAFTLHLPPLPDSDFRSKLLRVDFLGAITLVISIFLLLLSLDMGSNHSWFYTADLPIPFAENLPLPIALLVLSFLLIALFLHVELHLASEPFAPRHIILSPNMLPAFLVNFFGIAAGMSVLFHISLWFQAVLGRSASEAGSWLVLGVAGSLTGSLVGGMFIQKTGRYYRITVAFYWIMTFGIAWLVFMTFGNSSDWMTGSVLSDETFTARVLVAFGAAGLGLGLFTSAHGNGGGITTSLIALISNAGQADQAVATAVSYLFRSLGYVLGIALGSTIVQGVLKAELTQRLIEVGHDPKEVKETVQRVRESLDSIPKLDPQTQAIVRSSYANAINAAIWFALLLSLCGAISSIFINEKPIAGPDSSLDEAEQRLLDDDDDDEVIVVEEPIDLLDGSGKHGTKKVAHSASSSSTL
ncbi:MFS general substrate transporter [Pluteus cervinus]|uniref:MFS general substrate transporter n=1 Tax=Pluteus cervinus TaxID=181527 RepID=A0ACD3B8I1_9AGAR|nr:MFS general substrate transporter [Pluteus cervinus]